MAQNKEKGQVFGDDNLEALIEDLEFEIADHIAIIQDRHCKVRRLKQELKNRDKAQRFENPKSYNFAIKHPLDRDVYEVRNLVLSEVSRETTKGNRSTNIETKKSRKEVCIESHLTLINKETSDEEKAKGKEKVTIEACKLCK